MPTMRGDHTREDLGNTRLLTRPITWPQRRHVPPVSTEEKPATDGAGASGALPGDPQAAGDDEALQPGESARCERPRSSRSQAGAQSRRRLVWPPRGHVAGHVHPEASGASRRWMWPVCEAALTAIGATVPACRSVDRQPKIHRDPFWPAAAIRGWRGPPDVVSAKVTELLRVGRSGDSDPDADPGAERPANDPYPTRSGGRVRCDAGR
jgi:hypothetical protein